MAKPAPTAFWMALALLVGFLVGGSWASHRIRAELDAANAPVEHCIQCHMRELK